MKLVFKPLLIAALMATAGVAALAQSGGQSGPLKAGGMLRHDRMDPAKMHEMMATRQAELKARLKLDQSQESAWASYVAAMQPPADMVTRMDPENRRKMREQMAAMTTPERIDHMYAMKTQRDAAMAVRGEATKAFYAVLSAAQQKVFDSDAMRHGPGGRNPGGNGRAAHQG